MTHKVVGLLGGGQIGHMLIESANQIKVKVNVLDAAGCPAKQIHASHEGHVDGSFKDPEAVAKLAANSDVLTVEIEHVDTGALERVSGTAAVEPSWKTIRIIQDKFAQKNHLAKASVAVVPYEELRQSTTEELSQIGGRLGYPLMLKAKTQAYDGRGNFPVFSQDDISEAISNSNGLPLYAEKWANFRMELAVMVVKTKDAVLSFPVTETVHEDSQLKLSYTPARGVRPSIASAAEALARDAIASFEGKGVFGVEMFLLHDNTLLVNEIAPRPHNSGHYTIEACVKSQYDAHLAAILDLPLVQDDLRQREPAILLNILGGAKGDSHALLEEAALKTPGAKLHVYGKGQGRPARKMGHVTITAPTMAEAERRMQPLIEVAEKIRSERTDLPKQAKSVKPSRSLLNAQPHDSRAPLVAVIMGSDSDLPKLVPGLEILEKMNIPYAVRITSAHRTPQHMIDFCRAAAGNGLQCIIAAAGGAAHLPGMAASETSLPVIGVPIKGSVLDGVDSLHSIVQMPRGVPVATVGINNSVNAALLAARIIGVRDSRVSQEVEEYAERSEQEVLGKDLQLYNSGWKSYVERMK